MLQDCHVLTFASNGTVADHLVLHPGLETGNFIIKVCSKNCSHIFTNELPMQLEWAVVFNGIVAETERSLSRSSR